ncbi:MAG: histidine kinase, partial [Odoribacter sp.]|nr:histidine kinase [Odoribacter sp.]
IIYYSCVLGAIYFNIYKLIPCLLLQKKWISYIWALLGVVLGTIIILGFAQQLFMQEHTDNLPDVSLAILSVIASTFSFTLLMAGTTAIMLLRQWVINSIHIAALETSALESELTYLKNQINPHFLFNMLNNAYLLTKTRKKEASEVLFQLEDMLKYQINNSSQKTVKLVEEIKFLQDFLNTEKVRRDNFSYTLKVEGNIGNLELPPLLFIPFVENVVKHNWHSEKNAYVKLKFQWEGKQLFFYFENSKSNLATSSKEA